MGKIKQGILGGFRGTVGTVVGSSWNGIAYMKGKPQSVKNPKTDAQLQQRGFFRDLQQLVAQLSDEQLASLFPTVTRGMTRRNMLTRQLAAAAAVTDDVKAVDLAQLEGIGNGERIDSPMLESMVTVTDGVLDIYAEAAAAEALSCSGWLANRKWSGWDGNSATGTSGWGTRARPGHTGAKR